MARLFGALMALWCLAGPASAKSWKATLIHGAGEIERSVDMPLVYRCGNGRLSSPASRDCGDSQLQGAGQLPFRQTLAPAYKRQGLPDGDVAVHAGDGDLKEAWYTKPTERYGHAILGDAIEAAQLSVKISDGTVLTYTLPENQVFEDRTPRLHDLDGFGRVSVVTILSDISQGASLAVFGLADGQLRPIAQTPYIGRSNRWRNIAAIDDFDGRGSTQIAEVVTPHIGGTLKFWTWSKGGIKLAAEAGGFSNHAIGSREQRLSAVEDFDGDGVADIALPSADRKSLRLVKLAKGEVVELARIAMPARIDKAIAASSRNGHPVLTVGLEDGSVYAVSRQGR